MNTTVPPEMTWFTSFIDVRQVRLRIGTQKQGMTARPEHKVNNEARCAHDTASTLRMASAMILR